ncbi:MAG TPA: type I restriction-modification system subunit M N-terminal domain-containing protein, partial [Chloroflexota bacterium]
MPNNHTEIEKKLWQTADELRANSKLKASEYSVPVLGLIFLRFADQKFRKAEEELAQLHESGSRRAVGKADYQGRGVLYLPDKARFSSLLQLPEGADIAQSINDAMRLIEDENEDLKDVLPKNYQVLEKDSLVALLKMLSGLPTDVEGDAFGKIYEYFLGNFAMAEGQKGGEFFTPISLVK